MSQPNIDEKQHNNHICIAFDYSDEMRARKENDDLSVHVITGTHCVLLGLDVKGYGPKPDSSDLSTILFGMSLNFEAATRVVGTVPIDSTRTARAAADVNLRNLSSGIFVGFNNMKTAHIWHNDTFIERRQSAGLMHNKFIILVKNEKPVSLWTGSINFTDSGKQKHQCKTSDLIPN